MTQHEQPDTYTYRGRSLEELVPKIRSELGDDAVIVARRETSTGGVGGFFARREIEVEVRPGGEGGAASAEIAAFARQLADAHERQEGVVAPELSGGRPAVGPEIDALPSPADVTVDDLFPPAAPVQGRGLASLFSAGLEPTPEPEAPPAPRAPEVLEDDEYDEWEDEQEPEADEEEVLEPEVLEPEPVAVVEPAPVPAPDPVVPVVPVDLDQPTGVFDYLGVGEEPDPVAAAPAVPAPTPAPVAAAPTPAPVVSAPAPVPASAPALLAGLPPAAREIVERMAARGLRPSLAEAVAEEAVGALAPLAPDADLQTLVGDALARRLPVHPLRRGPGVVGFVGPGGAGKTRCVARLAAAHARHGAIPVAVVSLRSPDNGAELARLLAPYDVALHAVESGAEGAARIAALRGTGLVVIDTPGISPRSASDLRALGDELRALAPDELHLTVSATTGPEAARELVGGVRELGVSAVVVTHTDETEILGTVIGLAVDCHLPLSYLARGQAVEAGLSIASPAALAADLIP